MRKTTNLKKEVEQNLKVIYQKKNTSEDISANVEIIVNALTKLDIQDSNILKFHEKVQKKSFTTEELENFITDVLVELK